MKKKPKSKRSPAKGGRNAGGADRSGDGPRESGSADERVVLKPFLGMKPGVYLTVLYSGILALILFFVLFYPGIHAYGAQVTFSSNPTGASVLVDGIRVGATPITVFVKAGTHSVIIRKPYFTDYQKQASVPGRLFGSLFVPARRSVQAELDLSGKAPMMEHAASAFASWALIGEAHGQYQFPPVLTETVKDLYSGKKGQDRKPSSAADLLDASLLQVQSPTLLRDYLAAELLDSSKGGAAGPYQLLTLFTKIIHLEKNTQAFPLWLSVVLSSEAESKYRQSDWYKNFVAGYGRSLTLAPGASGSLPLPGPAAVSVDGIAFRGIPGGSFIMGREDSSQTSTDPLLVPSRVSVKSFYIMETEATRAMFARFLAANPGWRPSARAELTSRGLVDGSYLSGWGNTGSYPAGSGDLPVTDVSYAAAAAFAGWLNARLPAYLSGYVVRLPSEAEWEYAARLDDATTQEGVFQDTYPASGRGAQPAGTGAAGRLGIHDLLGNVWEWTADWYRPAGPALALKGATGDNPAGGIALGAGAAAEMPAAHRTVKGGSFANRSDSLSAATRGSLPPDWCTPYLGFRLVIAARD
ncbi:SUMF1/EgtB/PvdO family nonheme iron enzyme [Salinispira pacifica]